MSFLLKSVLFLLFFSLSLGLKAQNPRPVLFLSGDHLPKQTLRFTQAGFDFNAKEINAGWCFRLVQFREIPTNKNKEVLHKKGIVLLNYIPYNAYFAKVSTNADPNSFESLNITSIENIDKRFKLTKSLLDKNYPHWTLFGTSKIDLNAMFFEGISIDQIESELSSCGAEVLNVNHANTVRLRVDLKNLEELYSLGFFYYFEELPSPEEPENLVGRTNHRSNTIATDYNGGLKYDGTGITIMMQDDGYIGEHIDYEGRIDQSNCTGCSTNDGNNHGDHVAGTIMGAGNLDPKGRGMAFGADLMVFNSDNDNYDDVPAFYASHDMIITSKSYGAGCNAGYDSRASQLDQQVRTLPALIHVFSTGNSGTSDCGYGAGSGWGNITGGHKSGKNVFAVGNLNSTDGLSSSSSRGPATDGRIKPDICAVGTSVYSTISENSYENKSGTSMACPGVAGSIAQLYDAYKDINGGNNPPSGLIKATILNTADDLGNPGPDFKHGWGRINVRKAYELISQNNYLNGSISQGGSDIHNLTVPSGTVKLKIMLYWTDYEGAANASIALVNDLNMQVVDPVALSFEPWVLNSAPNASTLNDDAVRSIDALNNMEQVTIENPVAGTYTILINGFAIPQGPQDYFIVYEFVEDKVKLTYPLGGEGFDPGTSQLIRWDASDGSIDFTIDYSVDNGATWAMIDIATPDERSYSWTVPSGLTGEAKMRVTRGAQSSESEAPFSIIGVPENLDIGWACPDSLNLVWDVVSGATGYEVSILGTNYMDSMGYSSTNSMTVLALSTQSNWFSVRALGPLNARGERAMAIQKAPGQFGCTWGDPVGAYSVLCDSSSSTACVDLTNESVNVDASSSYLWYFPGGTPATSTAENPTVCYTSSGYQDVALVVTNGAGSDSTYFSDYIYLQTAMELPYHEGFEDMTTFNGQDEWLVLNPDGNASFHITTSATYSGVRAVRLSNYNQDQGDIDELVSGPINLSVLNPSSDIVTLSFRYAYVRKSATDDDFLRISVRSGCENNWIVRKTLHGSLLSPIIVGSSWTPSSPAEWTTVHITNITSSFFTGDFRMKFGFENDEGNNFFLDDINIYSGAPSDDIISGIQESYLGAFELFPNPADRELNVRFSLSNSKNVTMAVQDASGRIVSSAIINGNGGKNLVLLDTENFDSGIYFITLKAQGAEAIKKFVVR